MSTLKKEQQEALLQAIKGYIHQNYATPLSVQQIADALNTSVYQVQTVFMRQEHLSVHAYLKAFRMQQAAVLLRETRLSVGAIARNVGYESHSKFSRAFCLHMGQSPLRYRKEGLSGSEKRWR